ncbi:uncharacterized protein V2V93DRAFT_194614 [Kockiozyma suomiensis]|uniref:uncharacterized protein n=1 Tax=Kockiozyma suomiensis TaxID=1337062 RepID=UPI0033433CBC
MTTFEQKITRLTEWLTEKDVTISPNITAKTIDGHGIGVVAGSEGIKAGEKLVEFPTAALLNPRTAKKMIWTEAGICDYEIFNKNAIKKIDAEPQSKRLRVSTVDSTDAWVLDKLSSPQILSYYLYHELEKGYGSSWITFLEVLPTIDDFGAVPLVWDVLDYKGRKKYVEQLPKRTIEHAKRMTTQFWADLTAVQDTFCNVTNVERFVWAWMCVNSRCLYYKMVEARTANDCMTLAPFIDFLNHTDEEHCEIGVYEKRTKKTGPAKKVFGLWSTRDYAAGEEVYLCYGPHTNSFLLCEYGFTLSRNRYSELDITDEVLAEMHRERGKLCTKDDVECSRCVFLRHHKYLGDYTVSPEEASFRTAVALAAAQLPDSAFNSPLLQSRTCSSFPPEHEAEERLALASLEAFMATAPTYSRFGAGTREKLARILIELLEAELPRTGGDVADSKDEAEEQVRRLYRERADVARGQLAQLAKQSNEGK